MAFAEAHHLRGSGAVIFPDGFEAFEQIAFEFCQFGIKAFARAQEEAHNERFEDADTAILGQHL